LQVFFICEARYKNPIMVRVCKCLVIINDHEQVIKITFNSHLEGNLISTSQTSINDNDVKISNGNFHFNDLTSSLILIWATWKYHDAISEKVCLHKTTNTDCKVTWCLWNERKNYLIFLERSSLNNVLFAKLPSHDMSGT